MSRERLWCVDDPTEDPRLISRYTVVTLPVCCDCGTPGADKPTPTAARTCGWCLIEDSSIICDRACCSVTRDEGKLELQLLADGLFDERE